MVRGRRTRASTIASTKSSLGLLRAAIQKDCRKYARKSATSSKTISNGFNGFNADNDLTGAITRRTRKLRNSLQKIQKQFDNQAITNFFQVKLRTNVDMMQAHSSKFENLHGNDENACDAFAPQQLVSVNGIDYANNDDDDDDGDDYSGHDYRHDSHNETGISNSDGAPLLKVQAFPTFNYNHDNVTTKRNQLKAIGTAAVVVTNGKSNAFSIDGDDEDGNDDNDDDDQNSKGSTKSTTSSHNSIQQTNIFLQKPVLHLDIDKSLNQASSIVINKHLEVCPNFATTFVSFKNSIASNVPASAINTANSNSDNHKKQYNTVDDQNLDVQPISLQKNDEVPKRRSFDHKMKCKLKRMQGKRVSGCSDNSLLDALNNSDSNSCDSGVVADKSFEMNSTNGTKPTTPHRIVCPSTTPTKQYKQPPMSPQKQQQREFNKIAVPHKTTRVARTKGKNSKRRLSINDVTSLFQITANVNSINKEPSTATGSLNIGINSKNIETKKENEIEFKPMLVNEMVSNFKMTKTSATSRPSTPLQPKQQQIQSKQMTDFFPVRRSVRKTKKAVEQEYLRHIEIAIEKQSEDGLVVKIFKDKGRGICARRPFARGEFVVEYIGDLIEQNEADRREEIYAKDSAFGCYMYYFKHKEQQWCIDATAETGKLGRLVNHSRNGNLATKIVTYKNRPHLVLIAKENINEGEELTYDYGDRTRESLINHPWLAL